MEKIKHNLEVTDWQDALESGWQTECHGGSWSVESGCLRLEANQEGIKPSVELISPQDFCLTGPYALEISLCIQSIGLADNSTEDDTKFILEMGAGENQPGFQVLLVGDRYKLDVDRSYLQYLIFRSEPGKWYRWRFELRDGQAAMLRDGIYYSLHKVHGSRPAGLRVLVTGTSAVPACVEIGEITLAPLTEISPQPEMPPLLVDKANANEWPMFRRDRSNSAYSPLRGTWAGTSPEVAWSYPLGGWDSDALTWDIDGDGQEEVIIAYEGSLTAYHRDGTQIWHRNIDSPRVMEILDLDEDGQQEIVLLAGNPSYILVLNGSNGHTCYESHYDPEYPARGIRIGKLDPNRTGLQMVVWSSSEIGYCLGFNPGSQQAEVLWTYNYVHFNFTPEVVLVDMDRDGFLEVVLATYSTFFVYDGRSGEVKMKLEAPLGRNYGLLVVKDIDGDGYPDIVMLAESLREHITVVHNESGKSLRLLYDLFYEQNYPLDLRELRTLPDSVQDWDGDGQCEILYGLYDETDGDCWRTLLVDALTGAVKIRLENYYPLSLDRMEDGSPVAFLAEIKERGKRHLVLHGDMSHMDLQIEGTVGIFSFTPREHHLLAKLPSNQLLLDYSWRNFPLNEWPIFMQRRHPLRLAGEKGIYLVCQAEGENSPIELRRYQFTEGGLQVDWSCQIPKQLPQGQIAGLCRDSLHTDNKAPCILYSATDTRLYLLDPQGKITGTFSGGSVVGVPIVANLEPEKQPGILICSAGGQLLCLEPSQQGAQPVVKWTAPSIWKGHSLYGQQGQAVPVAFDWDQDGQKEILIGQPGNRLSILSNQGELRWSTVLPEEPTFWNYGNFTGGRRFDLFAAFSNGAYGGGCGVYSTASREPVWESGNGAYTTAIADFDGDGRDDILTRDLFWRRTLDGESARDIFPITQWAGYHTPTLIPDPQNHGDVSVVWTAGGYSLVAEKRDGSQLWWKPFMSGWRAGAVVDVDGDGRLEIGAPTWGKVFTWPPPMDPLPGLGRALVCIEVESGKVKWTYDPGASMSGVVSADVDGDGLPEFIFGTGDGRLIALRGGPDDSRRVVFSVQLPAALSTPVVCDPTGKEKMHILVGCADGFLYALN